jgi:hypothetical protein
MRRRHTLTVQPRKRKDGSAGQRELENDGEPVDVKGNRHPLSEEDIRLWGDSAKETVKYFCDTWPGDIYSTITIAGEPWDQVAPARVHGLGQNTRHVEVILRKR